ncbi:murein L,D-transpeptidase catalytic domain family protein [soil metagenome]
MKLFVFIVACIFILGVVLKKQTNSSVKAKSLAIETNVVKEQATELLRLKNYAGEIKKYANQHKYNATTCFFVDMKIQSGKKRFFVYDLKNDTILLKGMVTHGSGKQFNDTIQFSNVVESNCTSLGKYKIGNAYHGKFGLAYKLFGLDKTNSNAYARSIVLHAHPAIPVYETAPEKICTSWGCPTVAPAFLKELKTYIDKSSKPILLGIFN